MVNQPSIQAYFVVFAILLALLVATVGVAFIDLGPWNLPVALAIAVTKAVLILLVFMQVRYSGSLIWLVAGAGFFWLAIMLLFTLADYLTRSQLPIFSPFPS
jgi:cytochrome c oxidase subunit 4